MTLIGFTYVQPIKHKGSGTGQKVDKYCLQRMYKN